MTYIRKTLHRRMLLLALLLLPWLSGCTNLMFQPLRPHVNEPAKLGITAIDHYFPSRDGTRLHGWLLPAKGEQRGTVVFFHGNAENISTHIGSVWWLPHYGYNVFLSDYRGYGWSEGEVDLDGAIVDIQASVDYVQSLPELRLKPLFVFGQSMGGSMTISALARYKKKANIDGLIVEAGFAHFRQIVRDKLGEFWLTWPFQWPLSFTINGEYVPEEDIGTLTPMPILIIQDLQDRVIPAHHLQQLYEASAEPKEFWQVDAAHISAFTTDGMRQRLITYLEKISKEQ